MRLFTKIFIFGMLVFGMAFSVSGYFLLHYALESSMEREADFALKQYQYDKFTVQSALLTYSDSHIVISITDGEITEYGQEYKISQKFLDGQELLLGWEGTEVSLFESLADEISVPAAFFAQDRSQIYSEIQGMEPAFLEELSAETHVFRFRRTPQGGSILVGAVLEGREAGEQYYFVTEWDISKSLRQQETMRQYFRRCYLAAMAAGMVLLGILSSFLTGPLKRMSQSAHRMSDGDYGKRLAIRGRDEIGLLAESFNQMADAVEGKINELSKAAREKEDFVANFAHELKTPLTSIIGYADTMYQRDLTREEIRKASWHIWNEGMRLEALSLKLMELTVLERQVFPLQEMSAEELLRDVVESLEPMLSERQIELSLHVESAFVKVEYDLLKTLLLNLVDNSVKAGSRRIEILGGKDKENYWIHIKDDGCGMKEEELSRITEAFYMVDKARSRKQHGAGLGLALADRIARIHGGGLLFESREGKGTRVSFCLKWVKEDGEIKQEV